MFLQHHIRPTPQTAEPKLVCAYAGCSSEPTHGVRGKREHPTQITVQEVSANKILSAGMLFKVFYYYSALYTVHQ